MNKKMGRMILLAVALGICWLSQSPARAENLDGRIRTLEEELTKLKEQQVELKKEATAAAAALPTFEYRPGNGLNIEAGDKSWGLRATIETHFRYLFEAGRAQQGRTDGELMGRRFRPGMYYCIDNCLWEIEVILDLDGFGTGNAKNSTNTATGSMLHRGAVNFHAEKLNPWLPTAQFGMDVSTSIGTARQGSSSTGTQAEYDLLSRNSFDDGRAGQGMVLNWDNRPLDAIGIPGRINRFQVAMASVQDGDDGLSSFTNRKDFVVYLGIEPFSQLKNKWMSGLKFEMGSWFCNRDVRETLTGGNSCSRLQIQDLGNGGRQTLFDTGANSVGDGLATLLMPGFTWEVGPYALRLAGGFQKFKDDGGTTGKKKGDMFLIGHDLFLWSPKGFLTGSATTPGSILFGTHFERANVSCETAARCSTINGGQFHRSRILLREWDLFYFLSPRMSIGPSILWYNASNLDNRVAQAGYNLGLCNKVNGGNTTNCRPGSGGDWVDVMFNWRYTF
jgi:hypothetical protein